MITHATLQTIGGEDSNFKQDTERPSRYQIQRIKIHVLTYLKHITNVYKSKQNKWFLYKSESRDFIKVIREVRGREITLKNAPIFEYNVVVVVFFFV